MSSFCDAVKLTIRAKVPDVTFDALWGAPNWVPLNNGYTFYSSGSSDNWNENVQVPVRSSAGHDIHVEAQNPVMNYPWISVTDNKTGRNEMFRFKEGENHHYSEIIPGLHFYGFRTGDNNDFKDMNLFIELPK